LKKIRLIARMDIKAPNLIKGIHLEGFRVMGPPDEFSQRYYEQGIDEILYMDAVASLYERNGLVPLVQKVAQSVFIPLTVGGGIRSVEDARVILRAGADKVAVNTAALKRPQLIREIAESFGSQAVVLSVEAKKRPDGRGWEAYTDNGREHSGRDVIEWVQEAGRLGAGEVLVTSIDQEGTRKGFDVALVESVRKVINLPLIASGGFGSQDHLREVVQNGGADAVAIADAYHYNRFKISDTRKMALDNNILVRRL
jgi:imidazole glycerol-phosphate synthase subunit HisF